MIRALLFDLGGVLIDIDFELALEHWAGHSALSLDQLREAFRFAAAYEKHERTTGRCRCWISSRVTNHILAVNGHSYRSPFKWIG